VSSFSSTFALGAKSDMEPIGFVQPDQFDAAGVGNACCIYPLFKQIKWISLAPGRPGRSFALRRGCLLWLQFLDLDLQVFNIVLLSPDSTLQLFNH